MTCPRHPDGLLADGTDAWWCQDCHPERYAHAGPLPTPPADDRVGKFQRVGQSHTSRDAAIDATPLTGKARLAVLAYIDRPLGATDEECQIGIPMPASTQRPRRVELVERGHVRDSGRRRQTRSGRDAVVWERVP